MIRTISRRRLAVLVIGGLVASLAGVVVPATRAGAATCSLAPSYSSVTFNQGLGSQKALARGKDTLVKFYLSLPSCANTTAGDQITITGGTLTGSGQASDGTKVPAFTVGMYNPAGFKLGTASGAPYANQPADPMFLIPGSDLQPTSSATFTITVTASITYTATPGTASTSTAGTGPLSITTLPGSASTIQAQFERKTNALRVLLVEMVDPLNPSTFDSPTTPNAKTAGNAGMAELSRILPVANGISDLTCTSMTNSDCGGLRSTWDVGTLNLRSVPYTDSAGHTQFYDFIQSFPGSNLQLFCGGQASILFAALESMRQGWNTQNPLFPADRVVGVVDEANSWGSTTLTTASCPDGYGQLPSAGATATAAWVRSCYSTCLTANPGSTAPKYSITGSLLAMELSHTVGLVPSTRDDGTNHSPYTNADSNPSGQTPNRAFYLPNRTPVSNGQVIGDSHSAMKYASDSVSTWNDSGTLLEQLDWGYWQCVLGGALNTECSTLANTVGTTNAVPAGGLFTMTGQVTLDPTTHLPGPSTTQVVDSFQSPNLALQTPPLSSSPYRLRQLSGPGGSVCRDDGVPVSFSGSDHSGTTYTSVAVPGTFDVAFPFASGCTTRIELRYVFGTANILLYARDTSNGAPTLVANSVSGGSSTPGQATQYPTSSAGAAPSWVTQGPDGTLWFTEQGSTTTGVPSAIGHISQAGSVTEYPLPDPNARPFGIAMGSDGNIWFTERTDKVGVFNVATHAVTEYPLPAGQDNPIAIIRGMDGNLWITVSTGQIDSLTTAGVFTPYTVPVSSGQTSHPYGLTEKPDPQLGAGAWELDFTDQGLNAEVRLILPASNPRFGFSVTPLPTANALPTFITMDWYGEVWVSETAVDKVATIECAASGQWTEHALAPGSHPAGITLGQDRRVWVVEQGTGKVTNFSSGGPCPGQSPVEYTIGAGNDAAFAITPGQDGNLWITDEGSGHLTRVTTGDNPAQAELAVPSAPVSSTGADALQSGPGSAYTGPDHIASGPDGNLWFTERGANKIGRVTPTGVFTEFSVPTSGGFPSGITSGPDGNLWFTEYGGNKIGRITPSGTITEYVLTTPSAGPLNIVAGPDGKLWFTETTGDRIGSLDPSGTTPVEYPLTGSGANPIDITVGADGNLWFTQVTGGNVGKITTSGVATIYSLCGGSCSSEPGAYGITHASDGNLYVVEENTGNIDQVSTTGSVLHKFPANPATSQPQYITVGPDGNLWFSEAAQPFIGIMTLGGSNMGNGVPTPTFGAGPSGLTVGPDGNVWYADLGANKIARVNQSSTQVTAAATTSTGSGLQNLRLDIYYQCPNGGATYPVVMGLAGTTSGTQEDFSANVDVSRGCGGQGTFTTVVNDGFTQSSPVTANSSAGSSPKPPQMSIVNPVANQRYLQYSVIPLSGEATDAQDGDVTTSSSWSLINPSGSVVGTGSGPSVDIAPPTGGWSAGTYTVKFQKMDSAGLTGTATIPIQILSDVHQTGIADSVQQGTCFLSNNAASDPYMPWHDYDGDGIPNIDDPAPCSATPFYNAQEVFNPQTLNVNSNGNSTTVDITLQFAAPMSQVLPNSVQIERINGQPVSGFTSIHWSVTGTNTAVAQFSRSSIESYLITNGLVNRTVAFQVGGQAATWSFDGSCSTYASTS